MVDQFEAARADIARLRDLLSLMECGKLTVIDDGVFTGDRTQAAIERTRSVLSAVNCILNRRAASRRSSELALKRTAA
ncbi:MAG TPA: hypothetical protein VK446_13885 [Methylocystis sp.]|nr:hypothetical protein [Methylocystis sp.]